MSRGKDRHLRLAFRGEEFPDGDVPLTVLAAKLQALQSLFFHAAAAVLRDKGPRRGLWVNRYRPVAELTFVAAHHSELAIELALPSPSPSLFPEGDPGLEAADLVFRFGHALESGPAALDKLGLHKEDRDYLLRAVEQFAPSTFDNYWLELENSSPAKHPALRLTGQTRHAARAVLLEETLPSVRREETATLVGALVKIHIDVGADFITVRDRGVEIDCYYPDALRDQVANLLPGSLVEVTGEASLDNEGRSVRVNWVYEVETVSTEPLRLCHFEYGGVRYELPEPLAIQVEYRDGLWIYANAEVNLLGYGERREEAIRDLHANFGYLWREFAQEKEEVLDAKARQLRQRLLNLKPKVAAGG